MNREPRWRKSEQKKYRVQGGAISQSSTYCFTDGHSQVGFSSEAFGYRPGDGDVRHGDNLDGNPLLPLLAQGLGVLPERRKGK